MIDTQAVQFINQSAEFTGVTNITIPLKDLPAIQSAIIQTSAEAAILFFFIGVGIALVFAYLYFRIWKKANHIDEGEEYVSTFGKDAGDK
jgi:hypothetical protein